MIAEEIAEIEDFIEEPSFKPNITMVCQDEQKLPNIGECASAEVYNSNHIVKIFKKVLIWIIIGL